MKNPPRPEIRLIRCAENAWTLICLQMQGPTDLFINFHCFQLSLYMSHSVHTLAQIQCTIFQGQTLQVYVVGKMILAIRTLYK